MSKTSRPSMPPRARIARLFFGNYILWICRIMGGGAGIFMLFPYVTGGLSGPDSFAGAAPREQAMIILFGLALAGLAAAIFVPRWGGALTAVAILAWLAVEGTPPGKPAFVPGFSQYFMFYYILIFGALYVLAGWMLGPRRQKSAPDSPNPPQTG